MINKYKYDLRPVELSFGVMMSTRCKLLQIKTSVFVYTWVKITFRLRKNFYIMLIYDYYKLYIFISIPVSFSNKSSL